MVYYRYIIIIILYIIIIHYVITGILLNIVPCAVQ